MFVKQLFYVVFLVNCLQNTHGFLFGCSCGSLTPVNPYVFVNETLRLNCTLDKASVAAGVTSSDLNMIYGNDVIAEDVTIVNERTLVLEKVITSVEEETTYLCVIKNKSYDKGVVDTQYLKVDYKPQSITGFNCIVHDWDAWMNCSWELPKYKHLQAMDIDLLASNDGGQSYHTCPCKDQSKSFCVWNHSSSQQRFIPVDVFVWYFSITVRNMERNFTVLSRFTILPQDHVKPDTVQNLQVTDRNSSCISISWSIRKFRSQIFRISLLTQNIIQKTIDTEVNKSGLTVCDLKPSTLYEIEIRRKPPENGYWSEPSTVSAKTTEESDTFPLSLIIVVTSCVAVVGISVIVVVIIVRRRRHVGEKATTFTMTSSDPGKSTDSDIEEI